MVLIQLRIHGGDLALAKGIVERIVDGRGADTEAGGSGTINDQGGFEAAVLLIGEEVRQEWERAHLGQDARCPFIEFADVIALQGILVLRGAQATSDTQILVDLHAEAGPGYACELATQPHAYLIGGDLAFFEGFELDEHARGIDRAAEAATGKAEDVFHRRVLTNQGHVLLKQFPYCLKRTALVSQNLAK